MIEPDPSGKTMIERFIPQDRTSCSSHFSIPAHRQPVSERYSTASRVSSTASNFRQYPDIQPRYRVPFPRRRARLDSFRTQGLRIHFSSLLVWIKPRSNTFPGTARSALIMLYSAIMDDMYRPNNNPLMTKINPSICT